MRQFNDQVLGHFLNSSAREHESGLNPFAAEGCRDQLDHWNLRIVQRPNMADVAKAFVAGSVGAAVLR